MVLADAVRQSIRKDSARALARKKGFAWALGFDTLFKFKGFAGEQREHVTDMLQNSRVYFASPEQFNDPYDVSPVIQLAGDPADPAYLAELEAAELSMMKARGLGDQEIEDFRRTHGAPIDQLANEAGAAVRKELRNSVRVLCLSTEQCHPLQWSHYADHHRGVCLHFRCAAGTGIGLARQVVYQQERTPIYLPLERQSTDEVMARMVLVKADFWQYEREFRIIASQGVDSGVTLANNFMSFDPNILVGITVGMRMDAETRRELLALVDAHRPGLPVWEAFENPDRFWMQVRPLR